MNYGTTKDVEGELFKSMVMPGITFGIRQENKKWVVDHIKSGRSLGIQASSKKEAQGELMKIATDRAKMNLIKTAPSIEDTQKGWEEMKVLKDEFQSITGIELFIYPTLIIDIKNLDSKIKDRQVGQSISAYIVSKYGERADAIVKEIINTPIVTGLNIDRGMNHYIGESV